METTDLKALSTVQEIVERVRTRKFPLLKMSHDQASERNIVTFADGSQANVTIEDGWVLRDRKDLWAQQG